MIFLRIFKCLASTTRLFFIIFFTMILTMIAASATDNSATNHAAPASMSAPFTANELQIFKKYLFNNITTKERVFVKDDERHTRSIPGAVLASPSNKEASFSQDYQFHWTRDAALVMREVAYLYGQASSLEKLYLKPYLINYIQFEKKAQQQTLHSKKELGEPKYNLDGTVWTEQWGRPQNDGPALRAITMMSIAHLFVEENQFIHDELLPMVTTDLDYVVSTWKNNNYDLWEEVNDKDHFFTKMVQRKALIDGAAWMKSIGNYQRSNLYLNTAVQIAQSLEKHWNTERGYFSETINQQYFKGGGINTSIILGILYGEIDNTDDLFALNNDRVMSSIYFIRNSFSGLYKININNHRQPPLLGRYPNDIYDGDQFIYGNPWILTTVALAQYYYSLANLYVSQGKMVITKNNLPFFQQLNSQLVDKEETILQTENSSSFNTIIHALREEGDRLLSAIKQYSVCYTTSDCLHFAEQIDRASGKQTSAKDLTWGYASLLTAMQSRKETV